ncbi:hypothetical protein ACSFB8_07935 [Enterococcus faecalis]
MNKRTSDKLNQAESDSLKNWQQLEAYLGELSDEQRNFYKYLERIPEKLRQVAGHYDEESNQQSYVYYLLDQLSDEMTQTINKVKRQIEDRRDENQILYNQQIRQYETNQRGGEIDVK